MPRAKHQDGKGRGQVRTSRVRRREIEFIQARGKCEQCRKTTGLEAFWRSRDDRPLSTIQAYWLAGDIVRRELADKLIVLCPEHMRVHKGGLEHGGGVAGIKGCSCEPCKERRREYVKLNHRKNRAAKKARTGGDR